MADFGYLVEGRTYSMNIRLQNSGWSKLRYKVLAPADKGINVKYRIGPLAPGLVAKIVVTFKAGGGELREDGIYGKIILKLDSSGDEILKVQKTDMMVTLDHNKRRMNYSAMA